MPKQNSNRTSESDMTIGVLLIARKFGGDVPMTKIKEEIPSFVKLTPEDREKSKTRHNEEMWQQIVGNIVSHQGSSENIICNGYLKHIPSTKSVRITQAGLDYLKSSGY